MIAPPVRSIKGPRKRMFSLPNGVLVDQQDSEYLSQFNNWRIALRGDVQSQYLKIVAGKKTITTYKMHRVLIGVDDPKVEVDHKNGNKLDNRRLNLRVCSHSQNGKNLKLRKDNTSGFTGVVWNERKEMWHARIKHNYRDIFLGYFKDKTDAALCRYAAATQLFGEYAGEER